MNKDTGNEPAVLLSMLSAEAREVPLGLENFPTEIEVKVGDTKKKVPVAYFEKNVIDVGDYVHPGTGRKFSITERRLDDWVDKFNRMRAQGRETPCPVDHSNKAEDNRGFVVKMRRDGKTLKSTLQVFGEDGVALAVRNRCSAQFHPYFKDEKGNYYGDAIDHIAFTPIPVIGGQGPFVPVAASRGQQSDYYILSASNNNGSSTMDLTAIRELVGANKDVADEKVIELAITKLKDGTKATTDLADVQTKLSRAEEQVVSLSRKPTAPDRQTLDERAETKIERIENLVMKGDIPLALAKEVIPFVKSEKGDPNVFMLSRQDELNATPIDWFINLMKGKQLGVATGEETVIQLHRELPDGKKEDKPVTPERKAELLQMAGVTPPRA
jgi:hypothetical protein